MNMSGTLLCGTMAAPSTLSAYGLSGEVGRSVRPGWDGGTATGWLVLVLPASGSAAAAAGGARGWGKGFWGLMSVGLEAALLRLEAGEDEAAMDEAEV